MRIAAVSVAPIFPDLVVGGSQKILADVVTGLTERDHDIKVWCTRTVDHEGEFELGGATVLPELKLRGAFPATHQVSPVDLANTANVLRAASEWADRVYLHADAIYMRHALSGTEIVRSIHDYVYEEALISTLSLEADATIVPSEYLKQCVEATVSLAARTSIEPIVVVPNGVDVPPELPESKLPSGVNPRGENDLVLLYPHRPEPTKGLVEAIQTTVEVQRRESALNVRLLVPAYPPGSAFDEAANSAASIRQLAADHGAGEIVETHEWLSTTEMPGYLAAGDVTLCLGSFIESFGLIPAESIVSGTPAVCARVGALRQYEDFDGVALVKYGDTNAAADAVLEDWALNKNDGELKNGREQVRSNFSVGAMIDGYERTISRRFDPSRNIRPPASDELTLAPWTDLQDESVFNDYTSEHQRYPQLASALSKSNSVNADPLLMSASLDAEVRHAKEHGNLIPHFRID